MKRSYRKRGARVPANELRRARKCDVATGVVNTPVDEKTGTVHFPIGVRLSEPELASLRLQAQERGVTLSALCSTLLRWGLAGVDDENESVSSASARYVLLSLRITPDEATKLVRFAKREERSLGKTVRWLLGRRERSLREERLARTLEASRKKLEKAISEATS